MVEPINLIGNGALKKLSVPITKHKAPDNPPFRINTESYPALRLSIAKKISLPSYLIGYDLNLPHQDYAELIGAIKTISGTWWHHLDLTWIVVSNKTALQIRDLLLPHIDGNDELLVVELTGDAAWYAFNTEGSQWLKKNL